MNSIQNYYQNYQHCKENNIKEKPKPNKQQIFFTIPTLLSFCYHLICQYSFIFPIMYFPFRNVFKFESSKKARVPKFSYFHKLFLDGGLYHIETKPSICSANQWAGFYMTWISVIKELKSDPHFPKKDIISFNDSPSKRTKNTFYFILKALFVLKIFKILS